MLKKTVNIIYIVGLTILIFITVFIVFKDEIADIYFSAKYEHEFNVVKSYLNFIVDGDTNKLKEICDAQCRVLKPEFLNEYRMILKKNRIDSLKVDFAELKKDDSIDRFFTIVYFDDNKKANIHIVLKNQNSKWIMMSFGMSEEFK